MKFGDSYIITIDARAQDCFFEQGAKMSKFCERFDCFFFLLFLDSRHFEHNNLHVNANFYIRFFQLISFEYHHIIRFNV